MVGEAGEDVLEHAYPIEYFNAQLDRVATALVVGQGIPAHRQTALQRHLGEVGAILPVDRDAVVAEGHAAHDRLAGQGGTAAAEAILQALETDDRTGAAGFGAVHRRRRGRLIGLGRHRAGQVFVAEHRRGGGAGQPQLLPQAVEHLLQRHAAKPDRGEQVLAADQVAAPGHPCHGLAVEQGIESFTAQLPLQHGGTPEDVLLAMAAFIPLANAIARRGGGNKVEPIEAGMGCLRGDDLNEVAVLERRGQGAEAVVDAHALAMITHLGVDAIGKIHRR